ncbi:MAG: YceI family protein [bacterium]
MRYKNLILTVFFSLLITSFAFGADKYQFDMAHTSIGFSIRHMLLSNVKGSFKEFTGTILFDEKDITKSSVNITIKTASLDTDNQERDGHLKSAEFFDVEEHPEITFKSRRIEKNDDGYVLVGELTIKGVTKEVSFPFSLVGPVKDPWGNDRFGAEANLKINRQDFGVSWSKVMDNGGLVVGNDVKIELNVEAVKAKEGTN